MNSHPALARYVTWELGGDANNTSLQGEIKCSYADLVAVFGPPNGGTDGYKVDAGWVLTFTQLGKYKQVATIYNS